MHYSHRNLRQLILLLAVCSISLSVSDTSAQAQSSVESLYKNLLTQLPNVSNYNISDDRGTPTFVEFNTQSQLKSNSDRRSLAENAYGLKNLKQELAFTKRTTLHNDILVEEYDLTHNGYKVEHGIIKVLSRNDKVQTISGEVYATLKPLNKSINLTEEEAKKAAKKHIGATNYADDDLQQIKYKSGPISHQMLRAIDRLNTEYDPKAELVYVDDYRTKEVDLKLTYKFNIYATAPLSRDFVYVDVSNGEVILKDPIIKHGMGVTRYAGNKTFPTTQNAAGNFELSGNETISNVDVVTKSVDGAGGGLPISLSQVYALAVEIEDNNDDFTAAEHRPYVIGPNAGSGECTYTPTTTMTGTECNEANNDDVALDAHWGASVVARYWHEIHNRHSYDDNGTPIQSFVHYGDAYDNAFWNGSVMTYGDGSYQGGTNPAASNFAPLTSLDVCGHEIGHAVCTHTANLVYQRESGAMNEGFSDIWGAAIERYVLDNVDSSLPYDQWGIGEQIDERDGGLPPGSSTSRALRWMDDPKAEGNPDTYGGTNWTEPECGEPTLANDQCGVHNNSGVLNKWFYLLVEGSGQQFSPGVSKALADDSTNDIGDTYSVVGLGFTDAEKIAYLAETIMTPNSKFADARTASIIASRILFGPCSQQEMSVRDAWYGVGVGLFSVPCTPLIAFNSFANGSFAPEKSSAIGCTASSDIEVSIFSVNTTETVALTYSGIAVRNVDYTTSTSSLSFNGTEVKTITLTILDDKVLEGDETIIIDAVSPTYTDSHTITINDDEIVPEPGNSAVEFVVEDFTATMVPANWSIVDVNTASVVSWNFNGTGPTQGMAYATDVPAGGQPVYTGADSDIILMTPLITAQGFKDIRVKFDYMVGGEYDGTVFDYGALVVSYDNGATFRELQQFYAIQTGAVDDGTYDIVLNQLDNQTFNLGFKWFNDQLANGSYSFSVDNVLVEGQPIAIEGNIADNTEAGVPAGQDVFFISDQDGELIAKISNASADLGCVEIRISEEIGTGNDHSAYDAGLRSNKVYEVLPTDLTATYDLTLYYADIEVDQWAVNPNTLNIITVFDSDIDNISAGLNIVGTSDIIVDDLIATKGYITYTFTHQGESSVTLTDIDCVSLLQKDEMPVADGSHNASIAVLSAGNVSSTSDVQYYGGDRVELQSGFEVNLGGKFIADIDDCPSK